MDTLKLYLQNAASSVTVTKTPSGWDSVSAAALLAMDITKSGAAATGQRNADVVGTKHYMCRRFAYQLQGDLRVKNNFTGCIGFYEPYSAGGTAWNGYGRICLYALTSGGLNYRSTMLGHKSVPYTVQIGAYNTCGRGFSYAVGDAIQLYSGDIIILEVGQTGYWDGGDGRTAIAWYGGTGATDLAQNGPGKLDPGWVQFECDTIANPSKPSIVVPSGLETWRVGETHTLEYTPASPEQSASWACKYAWQLSPAGDFTDAIDITDVATGGEHEWTVADDLTGDADDAKVRARAYVVALPSLVSAWETSPSFILLDAMPENDAPVVSFVQPTDGALIQGPRPTFIFGATDTESDDIHIRLQLSTFAEFRTIALDSDSIDDYAEWEEAADPFTTWTTMPSGGATAGNRLRHTASEGLRYDTYYGRVMLRGGNTADWVTFSCTISVDSALALSVTIGGTSFYPTGSCVIVENTGGEPSPISMEINLGQFLTHPLTKGDEIAIASGLGNHNRSWNGTLEGWTFSGTAVTLYGLQDDAYLSRKIVTGDEASADLGANLKDFIDDYGTPLTGTAIDTSTGVSMALTGGYKYLREHFADAVEVVPSYLLWVDSGGDVHFVDQDSLDYPTIELYEEDPS